MKILGLDVGAAFCVGYFLDSEEVPTPPYRSWYRKHGSDNTYKLRSKNFKDEGRVYGLEGAIDFISALEPDVVIMEPTGVWYSAVWAKIANHLGIKVNWIGHQDLAANRKTFGFGDKDDKTDAFCLALSALLPAFTADRWITARVGLAIDLQRLLLDWEGLEPCRGSLVNQLRQRLHYEFPEIADRALNPHASAKHYTAWVGWLAGIHTYKRIEGEWERSIARKLGIEISEYTREHALALSKLEQRREEILEQVRGILALPELERYIKILAKYEFGPITQAAILANTFPFEKFLADGKRNIERWEVDGKTKKHDRSRAGYQLSLGMGKRLIESGKSSKMQFAGSALARKKLYCWVNQNVLSKPERDCWLIKELDRRTAIEHHPNQKQQKSKLIAQHYREWKDTKGNPSDKHKAGVAATITIAHRVTRLLYEDFVKEFEQK